MKFCTLLSGSSGNSTLVMAGDTKILVDCGQSGKQIEACLEKVGIKSADINYILVTHEHGDHTRGVGVFSRRYNTPVYATSGTWEALIEAGTLGKMAAENCHNIAPNAAVTLGDLQVTPFEISHDARDPVGYHFSTEEGVTAVIATDIGYLSDSVKDAAIGCDIVLLEANYDIDRLQTGPYPFHLKKRIQSESGHLSNKEAASFSVSLAKAGTKHIMLGHLSNENNTPQIAFREVASMMAASGIDIEKDVKLSVAPRYEAGEIIAV